MTQTEQVLYDNDHARVTRRAQPDGTSVVVKQAIGAIAIKRLAHEIGMLKRLARVDGVVQIAAAPAEPNTVVLDDAGGVSLADYLRERRLSVAEAAAYGAAVAHILARVHKAGLLHKDIGPANLLIHPQTLAPTLIDFNIAGLMADEQAVAEGSGGMAGTLSYMSPEQTGRTGRAADARSDLYSLGVTLYELLAGRKPFESSDVLELVHDHLVRVPDAPATLNAEVPQVLSDVVMRLLEKEPDRRYQSAEGLAYDLDRIARALQQHGRCEPFELGRVDYGTVLKPPAKLLGRAQEIAALRDALDGACAGRVSWVVLRGDAGSGKSALLDALRGLAAQRRAWFIVSQCSADPAQAAATTQEVFRNLGRQLLALPTDELAAMRERLLAALAEHLDHGIAQLPEFKMLLGEHPAAEGEIDPRRSIDAATRLLHAVASAERPLVVTLDNLHHATEGTLRLVEAALSSPETTRGLLIVGAGISEELDAHPALRALVARTRPLTIEVAPLAPEAATQLVGQMLRLPEDEARRLAEALALRTRHNVRHIVSFLNALRNDSVLTPREGSWHWDADAVRRHVAHAGPAELRERLAAMPRATLTLLQTLACLGPQATPADIELATGQKPRTQAKHAAAAIDEGLATTRDDGAPALAHERVAQAVLAGMSVHERETVHLALARRLDARATPERAPLIAAQYLGGCELLEDHADLAHAAALFEAEAQRVRVGDTRAVEHFASAAVRLLERLSRPEDAERIFELKREHHRALFEQGRLAEGDELYAELERTASDPKLLLEATRVQIYGQMNRRRMADGMNLGLSLLARLGLPKPENMLAAIGEGIKRTTIWYRGEARQNDFTRAEIADPQVVAWTMMVPETSNPAYFVDPVTWAWLGLEAQRLWMEYGPSPRLLSSMGAVQMLLVGTPQDYRGAYTVGRHALAVGEARGYEPATSFCRVMLGIASAHWVDPIETIVEPVFRRARADLNRIGDESFVSHTYLAADVLLDYAPTLDAAHHEIEEGIAFASRSNNTDFILRYQSRRQFIKAMRGQTGAPGAFASDEFDEAAYAASLDQVGPGSATYHVYRAMSAMVYGQLDDLALHAGKALPLSARTPGYYISAMARVTQGLALAHKARSVPAEERAAVLEALDTTCLKWLTARAADAPDNFLHLQRWLEAERAWAADTVWAAGAAFDAAVQESLQHQRPWHRALIHERAAVFHLSQGLEHSARPLLAAACEAYEAWGAAGKVRELRRQHAFLRVSAKTGATLASPNSTVMDSDMVDMMAVLRASQALSSETSLARLTAQVGKVLGAITGATAVQLVVHPEEGSSAWVMAHSLGSDAGPVTVDDAGARGELPLSAFRYAERTKEVLVIDDAPSDERFSGDPYVEKFAQCSLVLAPILKQGQLNAMLVLENHQRRAAFSAERLNSVSMIAGQLSVSLDNALLYASLEKRVAERTAQLRQKTNDINAMLQNMPQGVLTVVAGGCIHPEYSAYLATILETDDIAGRHVMDLLFTHTSLGADTLSQLDAAIGSVIGEDEMNFEFNSHLLVAEFDKTLPDGHVKSLALSWSPICDESGTVDKLMLCVRDVTELKRLEAEAGARKRELQLIGEILAVSQEKFHEFIDSARGFLDENERLIRAAEGRRDDTVNLLFRNMHTIKGNARTYGLLGLTNEVHTAEQGYDDLRKHPDAEWNAEALLAELKQVADLVAQYAHVNDTVLGRKGPGRRAGVEKFLMVERDTVAQSLQMLMGVDQNDPAAMRLALQHVGSTLHMLGTQPLAEVLSGTLESLPSLAQELGKEVPRVQIEDHGIAVRTQAGGLLKNLFTHLLRNSVDHGLESAQERLAAGKPAAGCISLRLQVDDGKLLIRLRDDGRGLAIGKIRQRATEQCLITRGAKSSADEVAQLIFRSGFSTADQVTEVSGRGVGMDAVRAFLEKEGGSIAIRFLDDREEADYRPFETVLALPEKYAASLNAAMSFDALCARMQAQAAARPTAS